MKRDELFWVAEMVDPLTRQSFAPATYWNGHTRPVFDPVMTLDIHEALKFRDAATCQYFIERLSQCKEGILVPMEHVWAGEPTSMPDEMSDEFDTCRHGEKVTKRCIDCEREGQGTVGDWACGVFPDHRHPTEQEAAACIVRYISPHERGQFKARRVSD